MRSVEAPRPHITELNQDSTKLQERINQAKNAFSERQNLIMQAQDEILNKFRSSDQFIVEAGTGTGKTLVLPMLLYEEMLRASPDKNPGKLIIAQPNRLLTQRASNSLQEFLGEEAVGYRFKGTDTTNKSTKPIEVDVEQTLLNTVKRDPTLEGIDVIVIDEVHRRNKILDVLIPLLKVAQKNREASGKPLKIVYTSATIDHEKLTGYLENAKHIQIEGTTHPIKYHFSPVDLNTRDIKSLIELAAQQTAEIVKRGEDPGGIITFLPGRDEIKQYNKRVEELLQGEEYEMIVLTGGEEGKQNQEKIKRPATKRRIYAVTPVAQEGITIDDLTSVIDLGLEKTNVYDEETGISSIQTVVSTQGNSKQRWGRAGRLQAGNAYMLYSEAQYNARPKHLKPEILRTDLSDIVLMMKSSSVGINDVENFDFIDHPGTERIHNAVQKLQRLGALNADETITAIGEEMLEYNLEPPYARIIVEAKRLGVMNEVSTLIGIMQSQSNLLPDRKAKIPQEYIDRNSDNFTLANIWNDYLQNAGSAEQKSMWQQRTGINPSTFSDGSSLRRELNSGRSNDTPIDITSDEIRDKVTRSLAVGLVDNFMQKGHMYYKSLAGPHRKYVIGENSGLYGKEPKTYMTGEIKKLNQDLFLTSYNFELSLEQLLRYAPYLSEILNKETDKIKRINSPVQQLPVSHSENTSHNQQPHESYSPSQNDHTESSDKQSTDVHTANRSNIDDHPINTESKQSDVGPPNYDGPNPGMDHNGSHGNHPMPWNEPFYIKLLKTPYRLGKSIFEIPKNIGKFFRDMIKELRDPKL